MSFVFSRLLAPDEGMLQFLLLVHAPAFLLKLNSFHGKEKATDGDKYNGDQYVRFGLRNIIDRVTCFVTRWVWQIQWWSILRFWTTKYHRSLDMLCHTISWLNTYFRKPCWSDMIGGFRRHLFRLLFVFRYVYTASLSATMIKFLPLDFF